MAKNLYEVIATRNTQLAKFFDDNHNAALLVKKIVGLLAQISHQWRVDASTIEFPEVLAHPSGKMIIIKVQKKGG